MVADRFDMSRRGRSVARVQVSNVANLDRGMDAIRHMPPGVSKPVHLDRVATKTSLRDGSEATAATDAPARARPTICAMMAMGHKRSQAGWWDGRRQVQERPCRKEKKLCY